MTVHAKHFFALLLAACMVLLPACAYNPLLWTNQRGSNIEPNTMAAYQHASMDSLACTPVTATHGEDYVISWEDAGTEAHVRTWLNRPTGDIYHSDVWDIQVVDIEPYMPTRADFVLTKPAGDATTLSAYSINDEKYNETKDTKTRVETPIRSLRDFRHFDSLVLLSLNESTANPDPITDISGLEACQSLQEINLVGAKSKSLAPLAGLPALKSLALTADGATDLTPLAGLPSLEALYLEGSHAPPLQALADLQALKHLTLSASTLPDLTPLTDTGIEYLDLSIPQGYDDVADYAPLAKMKSLVWLAMGNRTALDEGTCAAILAGVPTLKYLDISQTPAAKAAEQMNADGLELFIHSTTGVYG